MDAMPRGHYHDRTNLGWKERILGLICQQRTVSRGSKRTYRMAKCRSKEGVPRLVPCPA